MDTGQAMPTLAPALAPGTKLHEGAFTLAKVLGQGSVGITYMAHDRRLNSAVAIKEFVPAGCVRDGRAVQPGGALTAETFAQARHRDLKLENVMVCDDRRVVFTGFATVVDLIVEETQRHASIVASAYTSLEEVLPPGQRGSASEVYGLAAMLYHLLANQAPPPALERASGAALPELQDLNPHVSNRLAEVVMDGLTLEAAKRPQSVAWFVDQLSGRTPGWHGSAEASVLGEVDAGPKSVPAEFAPNRGFIQRDMPSPSKNRVNAITFSPDGRTLASGGDDQFVTLWDIQEVDATGPQLQLRRTLRGHTRWVTSVAFSPDGAILASGSADDTVRLWSADSGLQLWSRRWMSMNKEFLQGGLISWITSVAFSPTVPERAIGLGRQIRPDAGVRRRPQLQPG